MCGKCGKFSCGGCLSGAGTKILQGANELVLGPWHLATHLERVLEADRPQNPCTRQLVRSGGYTAAAITPILTRDLAGKAGEYLAGCLQTEKSPNLQTFIAIVLLVWAAQLARLTVVGFSSGVGHMFPRTRDRATYLRDKATEANREATRAEEGIGLIQGI